MIRYLADELGFNIVTVECFDIIGETATLTEGTIKAQLEKANSCAPSVLLLNHIEALASKSEVNVAGNASPIIRVPR